MRQRDLHRLKVGDKIKINTFHYRIGRRTVVRKITAIEDGLGIGVAMFGWNPFWLRKGEVIEKIKD